MQIAKGSTAVVIGGGSGIGMGIALALARAGASVVVADIEPAAARAVAALIGERGGRSIGVEADATDPASLDELSRISVEKFGCVQVLSNNVGVAYDSPLSRLTRQDWDWVIEFNLLSIVRSVAAFLPALRQGEEAHIVNTASMAALVALPHSRRMPRSIGAYTATKHAVLGYSEMLRGELAAERIGVSVLCPGAVRSRLAATAARNRPARYGGALPEPPAPAAADAHAMTEERVGEFVVAGIRANRLHILTHPELRHAVQLRHQQLLDDFDYWAAFASD